MNVLEPLLQRPSRVGRPPDQRRPRPYRVRGSMVGAEFFVVETDAPCKSCGDVHGHATSKCILCVWLNAGEARRQAAKLSGAVVRPIEMIPLDVHAVIMPHVNGRPDPNLPRGFYTVRSAS